ncbi:tripartite tricarboxylate transporter TctB family protein [Actinophytocola sediminis]
MHVATGGVVALVGLLALLQALSLAFVGTNGEPGPGLFPALLSGLLILLGLALSASYLIGNRRHVEHMERLDLDRTRMGRATVVWACFVIMVVLLPLVGFLPATLLLVGVLVLAMEKQRNVKAIAAVLVLPVAIYLVFAVALEVPLPVWGFAT